MPLGYCIKQKTQEGLPSPKQVKREMSDSSKDVLIAAIRKKISISTALKISKTFVFQHLLRKFKNINYIFLQYFTLTVCYS